MKTPMTMVVQAAGLIAAPLVLGEMVARMFSKGAWYDVQAAGFVLSLSYATIAFYLLAHSKLLIPRLRISLLLSLIVLGGIWAVSGLLMVTGAGKPLLMNLVLYGVLASLPLVLVGLHNLSWSLRQLQDQF